MLPEMKLRLYQMGTGGGNVPLVAMLPEMKLRLYGGAIIFIRAFCVKSS